ncbi:hypothetical protein [Leisingera sp. NJS201]|uniref:hypothetical protein n=1 Tax=Leisingera sp. NJS201 TaxID=2508306 RepID=UPI0020C7554D|nr:hypothetical protein [Leisingera sp. NJS201]
MRDLLQAADRNRYHVALMGRRQFQPQRYYFVKQQNLDPPGLQLALMRRLAEVHQRQLAASAGDIQ